MVQRDVSWDGNRPFTSCSKPLFQSEAKCESIDMEMIYSYANKTNFHKKGFARSLVLEVRVFGTRKWPVIRGFRFL